MSKISVRSFDGFDMELLGDKPILSVLLDGLSYFGDREYWLSAGTLLGLERDNHFIPYDTDIDIAVLGTKEIKLSDDYRPIRFIDIDDRPMQRAYLHNPTNTIFDIFHYYEEGDSIFNTQDAGTIRRPKKLVQPLVLKEYLGHTFSVPNDIDAYLTCWYGDWRIPVVGGKTEWSSE